MKKNNQQNPKKATAKPSGRKKLAVKAIKNERKNNQPHLKYNNYEEIYPLLSFNLKNNF